MNNKHVNLFKAYQLFFKNYLNFKGSSSRSEYWWAFFWNWFIRIILLIWFLITLLKGESSTLSLIILSIFCLAVLIPSISLTVRRYRNAQLSPYWILFTYLLPYVAFTIVDVAMGKTLLRLAIWNGCAFLGFICLICAIILPMFPTKQSK